jgi:hypothetical protein
MSKSKATRCSVGIVGAGYAGLTLANYLAGTTGTSDDDDDDGPLCHCRVLEAKDEPIPIVGTIRLPHASQVLHDLQLKMIHHTANSIFPNNTNTDTVDRQAFQRLLRKNISVEYSCRIARIERRRHDKYWLIDSTGRYHGPFDCVVVANGLCLGKNSSALGGHPPSAVLGDGRWQYDTWFWDFGRQRIQRGGDIALCDAMELAQALIASIQAWSDNKAISPLLQIPTKFQPRPTTFHHRWHTSKLVSFCAIVAILFRILLGLEKI